MIVKQLESPIYYKRKRKALPGRGPESDAGEERKSFEEYLIEAFQGEVVRKDDEFSRKMSQMTRENLIRLGEW